MKRIMVVVVLLLMITAVYSQATQGFNYQTVVRDANGAALSNKLVVFHISLKSGDGTITYYSENHEKTTTSLGIANMAVGEGTFESGSFATIPWSTVSIQMSVEIKPQGSTTFTDMGSVILRPVPFAMYALNGQPGSQGIQGEVGPEGPIGITGLQGPEGKEGPQGIQGTQGIQGEAGTGLTNKGNWSSGSSYISGDYVFATASIGTNNSMWVCKSATSFVSTTPPKDDLTNSWIEFQAPAGPQGIQGLQGNQGLKGDAGPIGLTGSTGLTGAQGNGIVETINNGNGTYTFKYTDNTQFTTSNLTGPQGQQGIQGIQGIQGLTGNTGATGADGKSINWRGNYATDPLNPLLNDAYYNTSTTPKKSFIYNGSAWVVMTQDGVAGAAGTVGSTGAVGPIGPAGTSIDWQPWTSRPASPLKNQAYYNPTSKISEIWNGTSWSTVATDGAIGMQGNPGSTGATGNNGISINWRGNFASDPLTPVLNDAYYNTSTTPKQSRIYNGTAWVVMTQDGAAGSNGTNGSNGASIIWKGDLASAPTSPVTNWAYYNTALFKSYVYNGSTWDIMTQDGSVGNTGSNGATGANGTSIIWKGSFASAPTSPVTNWAYYNTADKKSYVYDNTNNWQIITQDGAAGTGLTNKGNWSTGISYISGDYVFDRSSSSSTINSMWICKTALTSTTQPYLDNNPSTGHWVEFQAPAGPQGLTGNAGAAGTNGASIIWKGALASAPTSPVTNWAYYNTTDKKSYVYNVSVWDLMTQDGAVGSNGISIIWKGSLASAPLSPVTNWAYYNTTNKKSYVYDNTNNWQIITQDGANGTNGTNGTDGTSIIWKGSLASAPLSPLNNWAYYNTADKKSYVYNGSIWQIISQDGMPITGTTGQTLYNTGGSTWAASSNLFNNNTNVGIGTTTPTQKLEVDGNLQLDHNLYDYNTQPGTLNQILTSGGPTAGVLWKSPSTLSLPTGTGTTGQLALWTGTNNGLQGISNLTWGTNLQVTSLSNADPTAPIMEVRNILGQVVFAVYQSGVRIFVDHVAKGAKGGFAVGGLTSKADPPEYLRIYPDSARIYLNPPQKGAKGGFAVGGLTSKGESNNYMQMTPNNYLIGHQSGSKITTGIYNSFFGFQTGSLNTTGSSNVFIGYQAGAANNANYNSFMGYQSGKANTSGTLNSFIGYNTGLANTTGSSNVFIGNQAGSTNISGSWNTFLGFEAGLTNTGSDNTFIGYKAGRVHQVQGGNVYIGSKTGEFATNGVQNVFIGESAGSYATTASQNVFMGFQSGFATSSGASNVFLGSQAGRSNTTGISNVFIGTSSGYTNVSGANNVFLGNLAGYANTASNNVFLGNESGKSNTSGTNNAFMGYYAGRSNTSGSSNVFLGNQSGYLNTIGLSNIFIGESSGYNNADGNYNTFVGYQSGFKNGLSVVDPDYNTYLGYKTGYNNVAGTRNTYIGYQSGYSGVSANGNDNVFLGTNAGFNNTSGSDNLFFGNNAGQTNTVGNYNVFMGTESGQTSNANFNTFIGYKSGTLTSTGGFNSMVGYNAGHDNTTGVNNSYFGYSAGTASTGTYNTYLGAESGYNSGTGDHNVYLGTSAGREATGSYNVFIGYGAGFSKAGNHKLVIANSYSWVDDYTTRSLVYGEFDTKKLKFNANVAVNADPISSRFYSYDERITNVDDPAIIGEHAQNNTGWGIGVKGIGGYFGVYGVSNVAGTGSTGLRCGVKGEAAGGTTNYGVYGSVSGTGTNYAGYFAGNVYATGTVTQSSDRNLKNNITPLTGSLKKVLSLQGVNYEWKSEQELSGFRKSSSNGKEEANRFNFPKGTQIGVIAQDVEKVLPELVQTDGDGLKSVDYIKIVPVLIEAIKEQQRLIDKLTEEVEALKAKK